MSSTSSQVKPFGYGASAYLRGMELDKSSSLLIIMSGERATGEKGRYIYWSCTF